MRHPLWNVLFERSGPIVEVLDVRSDTTDLTTYTFTAVSGIAGALGSTATIAGDTYAANPHVRARSRKFIQVNVHAIDALSVYTVSTCTIGGVGGTKIVDAGGLSAASAAAFIYDTQALQGITSTDVVVTFSEAVTSCAIGVLAVSNIGVLQNVVTNVWGNTGDLLSSFDTPSPELIEHNALLIGAGTVNAASLLPSSFRNYEGVVEGSRPVEIAYMSNNAEMSYYCGWTWSPQYNYNNPHTALFAVDYTGTADGVAVGMGFI